MSQFPSHSQGQGRHEQFRLGVHECHTCAYSSAERVDAGHARRVQRLLLHGRLCLMREGFEDYSEACPRTLMTISTTVMMDGIGLRGMTASHATTSGCQCEERVLCAGIEVMKDEQRVPRGMKHEMINTRLDSTVAFNEAFVMHGRPNTKALVNRGSKS